MILLALALAAAPAAETPKAFLEGVYANYLSRNFSPFTHADRYFAPRLKAAIDQDARLAKGEVGYLDGDPICQCQDHDGLRSKILRVKLSAPGKATAEVLLDYPDSTAIHVRLILVRTKAGWRIADVGASDQPSLVNALEASNRKAGAPH